MNVSSTVFRPISNRQNHLDRAVSASSAERTKACQHHDFADKLVAIANRPKLSVEHDRLLKARNKLLHQAGCLCEQVRARAQESCRLLDHLAFVHNQNAELRRALRTL